MGDTGWGSGDKEFHFGQIVVVVPIGQPSGNSQKAVGHMSVEFRREVGLQGKCESSQDS